jgi:hypothetical protein
MKLTVDEIEGIGRSVARDYAGDLAIAGVTANDGEADHAELLFTLTGCHDEPCLLMLSVPRGDRDTMERDLRLQLGDALARHGVKG